MGLNYYAGIGSRGTPVQICNLMRQLSTKLESMGWVLRSGGARGADSAFEEGVANKQNMEIFLPGSWFNGKSAESEGYYDATSLPSYPAALKTVAQYHPRPGNLSDFATRAMARNSMQVLGPNLNSPSKFVIAWTPRGEFVGGTSQALRIAISNNIPVINLGTIQGNAITCSFLDGSLSTLLSEPNAFC